MSKRQVLGMALCLVAMVVLAAGETRIDGFRCWSCGRCCERVLLGETPIASFDYADDFSYWIARGEGDLSGCTHRRSGE